MVAWCQCNNQVRQSTRGEEEEEEEKAGRNNCAPMRPRAMDGRRRGKGCTVPSAQEIAPCAVGLVGRPRRWLFSSSLPATKRVRRATEERVEREGDDETATRRVAS